LRTQFFGGSLDVSWLYFTQDKKVIRNPKYGVNPIQLSKEILDNKNNVATYTIAGNKMTLNWGDGKSQTISVDFKNNVLTGFDGGICAKASSFSFTTFPDLTYTGLATAGSVARTINIFFGKDGKFKSLKTGSISGSGNTSGATASTNNEEGSYSIKGNTITFKYANGKEWIVVAQPYDLGRNDIIINDQLFKQK
jgi:hypothetical protein